MKNLYRETYDLSMDFHVIIEQGNHELNDTDKIQMRSTCRIILDSVYESKSVKTNKEKRMFIFKALDNIQGIMLDIEFLIMNKKLFLKDNADIYARYVKLSKKLYEKNQEILAS